MPISLNNSNISVTYNTGSNYIIETVKSDMYVRGTTSGNLSSEPTVSPSIRTANIVVESFTYTTGTTHTTYTKDFSVDTMCDILIVGGGGGGGVYGGGGGGGDVIYKTNVTLNGTFYISVGKGGNAGSGLYNSGGNGFSSSITSTNVSFISLFAAGGGGGGGYNQTPGTTPTEGSVINGNFSSGGGGGGGSGGLSGGNSGGTGNSVSGNGGNNSGGSQLAGGGGGAVGNGLNISASKAGNGGSGLSNSISGTVVSYGGGGGGGSWGGGLSTIGYGVDGGGNGAAEGAINSTSGNANTGGGGGGGGGGNQASGAAGGSGIVIIRYRSLAEAPTSVNMVKTLNFNYYSSLSPTIYTLTFNTRTLATINNGSDKLLNGSYTITLGNTLSTIVPTTVNQNLQDTKYSSSTISVSYHTLNPILDTKGAQWTYSSTNPNVYHLGSVGIGTTSPEYSLDVRGNIFTSVGGYTQTGTENWIIQSDRRIKENIVKASYEKCLDNIKKIELYNFNFKENYVNTNDRNQLGFIAQEVREVYPKAVIVKPDERIEELLTLNTTQIKYTLYGAVRSLIEKVERIEERVDKLYKLAIPDVEIKEITSKITEIFESTSNIII
jgi:hypothetical protein